MTKTDPTLTPELAQALPRYEAENRPVPVALEAAFGSNIPLKGLFRDLDLLQTTRNVSLRGDAVHAEMPAAQVRAMHMDPRVTRIRLQMQ